MVNAALLHGEDWGFESLADYHYVLYTGEVMPFHGLTLAPLVCRPNILWTIGLIGVGTVFIWGLSFKVKHLPFKQKKRERYPQPLPNIMLK